MILGAFNEIAQKSLVNNAREIRDLPRYSLNSLDKALGALRLQKITTKARVQCLCKGTFALDRREQENFGFERVLLDLTRNIYAVQIGQHVIDNNDIWLGFTDETQGRSTISGFPYNPPVFLLLKQGADTAPHNFVMIRNDDLAGWLSQGVTRS